MSIPDEAVEAGAKALWEGIGLDVPYEECREGTKRSLRLEARDVLEAAAPHLQPRTQP